MPTAFGYVDTTGVNPFDLEKAKALMAEAGIKTPLKLTMTLPPAPYARQGGELVAAQLAKIGIQLKLQNVEWAQWLSGTYTNKNYDLTLISHVEPFDLGNFAKPDYYWGYHSKEFDELFEKIKHTPRPADRARLIGDAVKLLQGLTGGDISVFVDLAGIPHALRAYHARAAIVLVRDEHVLMILGSVAAAHNRGAGIQAFKRRRRHIAGDLSGARIQNGFLRAPR